MSQMIVKWRVRRSRSRGLCMWSLSKDEFHSVICVRPWHGDDTWVGLIYVPPQNTPMTNSESKYQLFAPHLSPDYLLLNYQNGREHSITVYFFPWSCFIIFWSSKRLSVRGMKAMWPVSVLLDDWSCGQSWWVQVVVGVDWNLLSLSWC